jgi:hypothetical protein
MARPDPGRNMKHLADEFVQSMRDLDWELDYSEQSVRTLDDMIDRQFTAVDGDGWAAAPVRQVQCSPESWRESHSHAAHPEPAERQAKRSDASYR